MPLMVPRMVLNASPEFLRCWVAALEILTCWVIIPAFFFRKKGYINFVPKSVRRPSVRASVRPCVCASVTFLVIVSPPKPLEVATSNFVGE